MDQRAPQWKQAAVARARAAGLGDEILTLLDAFAPAGETPATALSGRDGPLHFAPPEVAGVLVDEVDPAQAAMFARRVQAVAAALSAGSSDGSSASAADQLLSALLHGRLPELLAGPRPRALRVRALADFVYSQHARLALGGHGPPPEALVAAPPWQDSAPGVQFASVGGQTLLGPQRLHLLRLDPARVRLRCLDRRDAPGTLADHDALAALSGGFFLYSEPDIAPPSRRTDPVGLLVDDGVVIGPPLLPRAAVWQAGGAFHVGRLGVRDAVLQVGEEQVRWEEVVVTTRAEAERCGRPGEGLAVVGDRVVARGRGPLAVPLAGAVLRFRDAAPQGPLSWSMPGVDAAMAGGPLLVRDGRPLTELAAAPHPAPQLVAEGFVGTAPPRTFSQDETGDRNLLPRLAVGIDRDGFLLACAVDGRDLGGALGLTLSALARVMAALGCVSATNLDGGSSKRMVVAGRVLDRPSTEILARVGSGPAPRRPVHSAILVLPR